MKQKVGKDELIDRALQVWRMYSPEYKSNLDIYRYLLSKKRSLKITPLRVLSNKFLRGYPTIELLEYESEDELREALETLTYGHAKHLLDVAEYNLQYNHVYNTVKSRIFDYSYEIRHHGERHSEFGINPDAITVKTRGSNGSYYRDDAS